MKSFCNLPFFSLFSFLLFSLSVFGESEFEVNRETFSPGSKIFFRVNLDDPGFIYLLNETSGGTVHLLFPNKDDPDHYFQQGESFIPSKKAFYEFRTDEDIGKEKFYLIYSKKRITKLHLRNYRELESIRSKNWLRKITSNLLPSEWKLMEKEIEIQDD